MKCDFLIVGAGLAGSILSERIATELNKKVVIIDRRQHIAGNIFDYRNQDGQLIHKYGPHIFHTNSQKQWDYITKFTEMYPYFHRVLGFVDGEFIPVPFNFNSLYQVFPQKFAKSLEQKLISKFGFGVKIPILNLKNDEDKDVQFLAEYIYKNVFLNYTIKQWGLTPEELDPSVTSRIPVFLSRDNRYFQDKYQGIPTNGYTKIIENMLNHNNIKVLLNADFSEIKNEIDYKHLIYTGAIDEYFDYQFGELPYRSLNFTFERINSHKFQEVAQVNYPNNCDYTRITEFKHFLPNNSDKTTIAYEYPIEFINGMNDRYYPIPKAENRELYEKYLKLAQETQPNTFFIGRLAEYKYYNMNEVVGVALSLFESKIAKL